MTAAARATRPTTDTAAPRLTGAVPVPRQRRARHEAELPLGSLTQREHQREATCDVCGSTRLTHLVMHLADGAAVDFTSCHHCEHRAWAQDGRPVAVSDVLARSGRR